MQEAKQCNKCRTEKPAKEFFKDRAHASGLYSFCKECKTKRTLQWRSENREAYNASMREYRIKNKRMFQNLKLKKSYDLTIEQYEKIFAEQGMCCAICKRTTAHKVRPFVVDHCHRTKKIRGVLCYSCNRSIHILDNESLLKSALSYLAGFK